MVNNIDINKIVVSNKLPFDKKDFKYFIGCKDAAKIKSLWLFRPRMSIYKIYFDKIRCISFLIKDDKFFDKYK